MKKIIFILLLVNVSDLIAQISPGIRTQFSDGSDSDFVMDTTKPSLNLNLTFPPEINVTLTNNSCIYAKSIQLERLRQNLNLQRIANRAVSIFNRIFELGRIQQLQNSRLLDIENQKLINVQQRQRQSVKNQVLLREIANQLSQTFSGLSEQLRNYEVKKQDQIQQLIDVIRGRQDRREQMFEQAVRFFQQVETRKQHRDQQRIELEKQRFNLIQAKLEQMQQLVNILRSRQQTQPQQQTTSPSQPSVASSQGQILSGQIPNGEKTIV